MFSPLVTWRAAARAAAVAGTAVLTAGLTAACADRRPAADAPHAAASGAAPGAARNAAPAVGGRDTAVTLADAGGRQVRLAGPAQRVISLIPSATETLIALGATDRVAGRTRYDVAPEVARVPSVGGGLDPSVEAIVALHPDLVLAWENDKRREVPNKLAALGVPVFTLRTEDTTDVFRNIADLGRLTGRDSAARALAAGLRGDLAEVARSVAGLPRPRVFYVVFNDPPMTAGPGTFITQLVGVAGGQTIFPDVRQPWPTVAMEEIVRRAPDLVVVPQGDQTNALEQLRARPGWRDVPAVRAGHVVAVPANLLNRPGPHLGEAARTLRAAFHPTLAAPATVPAVAPVAAHPASP